MNVYCVLQEIASRLGEAINIRNYILFGCCSINNMYNV